MNKKLLSIIAIVLTLTMVLAGCGQSNANSEPATESGTTETTEVAEVRDDIIIAQAGEPISMDPHNCYNSTSMRVYMNIFDSLTVTDAQGIVHPSLAKSWDVSEDGKEYIFYLRDDVKFHNGDPFTAKDVKYSFDRAVPSPYTIEATDPIETTEIIDDYTVKVTLKYPYQPQIMFFASTYLAIINENVVNERGEDFSINPAGAGTGPYKFESWEKGVSVSLVANEDYFAGAPSIKKVSYQNISESSAGDIAVETGDVDIYLHPSTVDIPLLKENADVKVYEADSFYCEFVGFNVNKAPFDNKLVRQAINYSIDKEDVVLVSVDGIGGTVAATHVPSLSLGHDSSIKPYEKDIEKAKELLAEAGYPDGFECTIKVNSEPRKKTAEAFQAAMAEIGIKLEILILESGAFYDEVMSGDCDMFACGMCSLAADADPSLYTSFSSNSIGITNYANYSNEEVDKLLMEERQSTNNKVRIEKFIKIQEILDDELPQIPLYFRKTINIANKNVKGIEVEANNFLRASNLSW